MDDLFMSRLFAWDLMTNVFGVLFMPKHIYTEYRKILRDYSFNKDIGKAVHDIISENNCINTCHREIWEICGNDTKRIKQLAFEAIPAFFPDGYSSTHFLVYCAMVLGVGYYYTIKEINICDDLVNIISSVLSGFIMTREFKDFGGMEELGETSLKIHKVLQYKQMKEIYSGDSVKK